MVVPQAVHVFGQGIPVEEGPFFPALQGVLFAAQLSAYDGHDVVKSYVGSAQAFGVLPAVFRAVGSVVPAGEFPCQGGFSAAFGAEQDDLFHAGFVVEVFPGCAWAACCSRYRRTHSKCADMARMRKMRYCRAVTPRPL